MVQLDTTETLMILQLLLVATSIFAPAQTPCDSPLLPSESLRVQDPVPQPVVTTAWTRSTSAAADAWFSQLISLNPGCTVAVNGSGIVVSKVPALTLPPGPVPTGVYKK